MTEENKPSESTPASLATLLRSRTGDAADRDAPAAGDATAIAAGMPPQDGERSAEPAPAPPATDGRDGDTTAAGTNATDGTVAAADDTVDIPDIAQVAAEDAPAARADAHAAVTAASVAAAVVATMPAPPVATAEPAPSFMRAARTAPVRTRAPRWQWGAAAALALLLAVQVVVADRARLAADAGWRPLVAGVCTLLRCSLPAWHQPDAFTMLTREVRPLPGQGGVLQIQASFRNDARWAQAWPALQLSLSDADGRVIGSQVFAPADYLGHAPAPGDTLAPGQSTQIAFRVREPAASTAAFNFEFH